MAQWDLERFREELKYIVNIDTGSYVLEGISKLQRYMAEQFENLGLSVKEYDDYNRISATTPFADDYDVMLIGHCDTVFPCGTVKDRPYSESPDGKYAYGPGVADMKSGLIMILTIVRRLVEENPRVKVAVAINGDEETSSLKSAGFLKKIADKSKYAFVFEPGRKNNGFVSSRKGLIELSLKCYGKKAHAGNNPEQGSNAILEASYCIIELCRCQNLERGLSINAGVVEGGIANNVIPDFCNVTFDIRYRNSEDMRYIMDKIENLKNKNYVLGVKKEFDYLSIWPPLSKTEYTEELIDMVEKCASELGQEVTWVDAGGCSDANNISDNAKYILDGCGPEGRNMHSDDEYLIIETISERLDLMYKVLLGICSDEN